MTRVRCEHAVIADEMSPWARYQGCQAGQKVQWLEQTVRGAITKRAFEFVHDQPVANSVATR